MVDGQPWLFFENRTTSIRCWFAAFILTLLTVACAPGMVGFYLPSAPDGKVIRNGCTHQRTVVFERHGVIIGVAMGRLSFGVPEGKVVILIDQEAGVSTREGGTRKAKLAPGIEWPPGAFQPRHVGPDKPLTGLTSKAAWWPFSGSPTPWGNSRDAFFSFGFPVSPLKATTYVLRLPRFSVNDIVVELPPVTFIQDSEFGILPLNC